MATTDYDPILATLHKKFETAFNAADLQALLALYAPDAVLIPAPGEIARGHQAIRAAFEQFFAGKPTIYVETSGVFQSGDTALTHGKWTMKGTGPDGHPFEGSGSTSEVLRRQPDGRWLYVIDDPYGC